MKEVNTEQTVALSSLLSEGTGSQWGRGEERVQKIFNGYLIPWESDHTLLAYLKIVGHNDNGKTERAGKICENEVCSCS